MVNCTDNLFTRLLVNSSTCITLQSWQFIFYFANGIFVLLVCVGKIKVGYVIIRKYEIIF
nr:MAG TPA: hypothetical protein [Caudoviricetes sp.]